MSVRVKMKLKLTCLSKQAEDVCGANDMLSFDSCERCHQFHADGKLECGHTVPCSSESVNAALSLQRQFGVPQCNGQ